MQDNWGIFVIRQLSKPKVDADRRKPEVNYLGGRTVRVIPDSPKARGGHDLSQLFAFFVKMSQHFPFTSAFGQSGASPIILSQG